MTEVESLGQGGAGPRFRGLYAIADADSTSSLGLDLRQTALALMAAGPAFMQLRAKGRSTEETVAMLQAVLAGPRHPETRVVQNDRADVAQLCGAHGVHVGQSDLPAGEVKAAFPDLLCGLSTHSLAQLKEALLVPALDYVALGPIFRTNSKKNPEPEVGLAMLKQAHELTREAGVPLVAIGGIGFEDIADVAPHCELLAAISLLLPTEKVSKPYQWIEERAAALHEKILGSQRD